MVILERRNNMRIGTGIEKDTIVKNDYAKDRLENSTEKQQQEKTEGKSINASELNLFQDGIAEKKKKAMEDAMEFIKKQFESDSMMDDYMEECRGQIAEGKEMALEASKELKAVREQKEQLMEEYPDQNNEDYKAYMKDLNKMEEHWQNEMKNAQSLISDSSQAIKAVKQEALKHHGMVDATKAAEKELQAASKEIIGMLMEEAKDTVDEELEEKVEEAEETKEEKEEKETDLKEVQLEKEKKLQEIEEEQEKRKKMRENRKPLPSSNYVQEMTDKQQIIRENIDQVLEAQSLLSEEIKGMVVDCNL